MTATLLINGMLLASFNLKSGLMIYFACIHSHVILQQYVPIRSVTVLYIRSSFSEACGAAECERGVVRLQPFTIRNL